MKQKKPKLNTQLSISPRTNVVFNIIMIGFSLLAILPILFVLMISITSEASLNTYGYRFIPKEISFDAYRILFSAGGEIFRAYGTTIVVTLIGTVLGLTMTSLYAYVLSRRNFAYKKFFNLVAFIPMLFSGGMVANYLVMTKLLKLKDNIWALILPLLMNTFYIVVMRTFYQTTVPEALIEAAKIDGANEYQVFFRVVLPISLPGHATIALFLTLGYWNDWFNAMLYMSNSSKYIPLQYLLIQIQNAIDFLSQKGFQMGSAADQALSMLPKDGIRMAIVVISTLPIALAYPFFQRYFVQGLTLGAVKE